MSVFPRDYSWIPGTKEKQKKNVIKWNLSEQKEYFIIINVINYFLKQWTDKNENEQYFTYVDCTQYFFIDHDASGDGNANVNVWKDDLGNEYEWQTGSISNDLMYDFLHLTLKGYQAWTQCLQDSMQHTI